VVDALGTREAVAADANVHRPLLADRVRGPVVVVIFLAIIVVAVLGPGEEMPVVDRIFNDEESVRRLIGRFADRRMLSACYEAGPGGYELYRLLSSMGVYCEVLAPSLIPKGSSERVKTDKRDAIRLRTIARS